MLHQDLRQVGIFLQVFRLPPQAKLECHDISETVAKHHNPNPNPNF